MRNKKLQNWNDTTTLNKWRKKDYQYLLHCTRKKKRDLLVTGKQILSPLWKTKIWKMETGRTDYCGNWRWNTHQGMSQEQEKHIWRLKDVKRCTYKMWAFFTVFITTALFYFYSTHSVHIYTPKELFSQLVTKGWCKLKCCPKWQKSLQDPWLKVAQLSQNSITINKLIKFPDTVTKTSISVILLKTVLLALLQNIFRRMPVNGHNVNKRAAKINFHLPKIKEKSLWHVSLQMADGYSPAAPALSFCMTHQSDSVQVLPFQKAFLFFVFSSWYTIQGRPTFSLVPNLGFLSLTTSALFHLNTLSR